MLLKNLIKNIPKENHKLIITGLSINSKEVKKGHIFFAIKGNNSNGERFVKEAINKGAKDFVLDNNKDNKDIGKIFTNHVNKVEFEQSMRQFHMNPSTSIPNTQDDFLKYCYGDLYSEKPLKIH